jgi:hypothetical protein
MWPPALFRERTVPVQILLAGLLPLAFGALCGYLLGASSPGFKIVSALGAIGGIGAGFEHDGPKGGFWRGLSGGTLFAAALVITHRISGAPPLTVWPLPLTMMAVIYALTGIPFGVLGSWLRERRDRVKVAGR